MLGTYKRYMVGVTLLLAVSAIGVAVAANSYFANPSTSVVRLDASWAKGYTSIAALKQDADLAVDGTIGRVIAVTKDSKNLVFTDYALEVRSVAFNRKRISVAPEIVVHQTGGTVGNTRYEVTDDPLFNAGEHVVLFLQQYSPGHYFVIGGPTGRFEVQNGLVKAFSPDGVNLGTTVTEDSFLSTIASA